MGEISLKKVSFQFKSGFKLEDISFDIQSNAFLGIIGPNGSGKTTLLRLISGLLQPNAGTVTLNQTALSTYPVKELAKEMAVISSEQYFEFPFPVQEVVAMGRHPHVNRFAMLSTKDKGIIEESLEKTDLIHLRKRLISQLSSGEKQRVLIARALAQKPKILILDEPNAHLDINHQMIIFELLKSLNRHENMGIIVVLHDLNIAAAYCKTLALFAKGQLIKQGMPKEVITQELIQKTYETAVEVFYSRDHGYPQVSIRPKD